ncbi:hypothetical protein [Paraburkholderia ferrariae]|jgi:hypothetical protein|uniref:hypothetical protein n=1 Tax=Paraburkholderia ferrariae TaxID=386056 RepID=UPI0005A6F7BC|nr:hypothetical protein [Paraburkholderia ferrariae]
MTDVQGSVSSADRATQINKWLDSIPGRVATAILGFCFVAQIAYGLHTDPRWHWHAGTGKLPGDIVQEFMNEAYTQGKGVEAYKTYFSEKAVDNAPNTIDHQDGAPIPDEVRKIVVEGMDVAVYHTVGATRGQPAQDVVDLYEISGSGWIIRHDRIAQPAAVQRPAAN